MSGVYVQVLLVLMCAVVAFVRGTEEEQGVAGGLLGIFAIDFAYHILVEGDGSPLSVIHAHASIDLIVAGWFAFVALKVERLWPTLILSAQLFAVLGHIIRVSHPDWGDVGYSISSVSPSYLQIAILLVAMMLSGREQPREEGRSS